MRMESIAALLERAYAAGWTQQKIAEALGVTDRTLRRWYSGDTDIRLSDYRRLVDLLRETRKRR